MRSSEDIRRDLADARSQHNNIADELLELSATDGLTAGELTRQSNLVRGLDNVKERIKALQGETEDAIREAARNPNNVDGPRVADRSLEADRSSGIDPRISQARSNALRANERADFLSDESRTHMESTLRGDNDPQARLANYVNATASRDYFRAFSAWMRDPVSGGHAWSPSERDAVLRVREIERSMTIGSGAAGGFLVPYELDPSILIAGTGAVSPLREIARVETTAFNEKRFVTSLGVTSTWTPEETQQTDDSPALLQPAITCKKGQAFVPVSFELYEDSSIAQEIGNLFADAKVVHENLSFTLTQSNGPTGIISSLVTGASSVIATGTNVQAVADLYTNQGALPPRWRPNASWMMALPIINGYRALAQASGLNYSVVDDSGPLPRALGWPIYENSSMDSSLSGSAADYAVLSGDFKQFAIVDRVGTSIEVVQNLVGTNHRPTGQRGFLMHYRSGSDVLIQDAFRLSNFST